MADQLPTGDTPSGQGPKITIDSDWKAQAQAEKQKLSQQGPGPQIQVDSDWKAQAQAEKEKLAQQAKAAEGRAGGAAGRAGPGALPPSNFETLVSTMATQALFAMGAFPDPRTGQRVAHLDLARHHIDMLGVLEQKTKGNLTEEETNLLAGTVYELRTRYIQIGTAARGRE